MVVAKGGQGFSAIAYLARFASENSTNAGQRQIPESRGHRCVRTNREEQFVIFASVQSVLQGRAGEARWTVVEDGRHARRQTETMEVERQPVAQVHGGTGFQFVA